MKGWQCYYHVITLSTHDLFSYIKTTWTVRFYVHQNDRLDVDINWVLIHPPLWKVASLIAPTSLAVSSSPRPWIDVFALHEKSNMAVTESDPDPKVRKNVHNFLMTARPLSWACGHGAEMLLILKNLFLTWICPNIFRYDSPKKCPTILYALNLWLKPVSATGATTSL